MQWGEYPARVDENVPLAGKTTWRIGGNARFYAEPRNIREVSLLLKAAERNGVNVFPLGGGSNLLITDDTVDGLVLRLSHNGPCGDIRRWSETDMRVVVGAAVPLQKLVSWCAANGLGGVEDLAGIPGTVGGAVVMNAGGPVRGIGSCVEQVIGVDRSGRRVEFGRDRLRFGYRDSNLRDILITEVVLRFVSESPVSLQAATASFREQKRARQPLEERSAGCVFCNTIDRPAGFLIDEAGLKGYRVGDALVSKMHANFILNVGNASFADVRSVINHVRSKVQKQYGVTLKLEISLWV